MSDQGKPLARRTAEYDIDIPAAKPGDSSQFRAGHVRDGLGHNGTMGEIEFMDGGMNGIDLDRCRHIEARLLET
jgi:hypothetical protein